MPSNNGVYRARFSRAEAHEELPLARLHGILSHAAGESHFNNAYGQQVAFEIQEDTIALNTDRVVVGEPHDGCTVGEQLCKVGRPRLGDFKLLP